MLGVTAVRGLANGLKNELDSNKSATSAALFISELYLLGWLTNRYFLQCMDWLSRDNFETLRYVEVMTALLDPATKKIKMEIRDDRFMFYLQLMRAKQMTSNSRELWICSNLTQILEKIVAVSYNDLVIQPIGRNPLPTSKPQPISSDNEKLEEIVALVKNVDLNDLELAVRKIDWITIKDEKEVNSLAATLVQQAMLISNRAESYAQLTFMLSKSADVSFKKKLTNHCQQKLLDCFSNAIDKSQATSAYGLVQFIASLHSLDIINQDFIKICLDIFISKEKDCEHCVHCISIFMQSIGFKLEANTPETIAKIFKFFDHTVASENTFRANVYKKLIELRNNKWIATTGQSTIQPSIKFEAKPNVQSINHVFAQPPVKPFSHQINKPHAQEQGGFLQSQWLGSPLIYGAINSPVPVAATFRQSELLVNQVHRKESHVDRSESLAALVETVAPQPAPQMTSVVIDFEKLKYEDEIDAVAFDLKDNLTSIARITDFINALIRIPFKDHKQISTCAELLERLTSTTIKTKLGKEIKFSKSLLDTLNLEFVKSSGLQALDKNESDYFANVSILIAELYKRDIFSDDDLSTWLLNKHTKSIPVQHLSHLSAIVSPKIQASDNKHLKMILGIVEGSIQTETTEIFNRIQDDINSLFETVTYMKQFKENNPQTNGI